MDFGFLPPEVNSGRMYTGPGPGPMLAAAAAWDALAAELRNMAAGYDVAVSDLTAGWQGPSSAKMAAGAAPYTEWLHTTATQAEQAAAQGRTAAAAYEAAFAATVPPPVIAANRSLLLTLIATNFLGQNTPAIATTEAHYGEMWAQDATAMQGYSASSAAATQMTPFTLPPETTNPVGAMSQSAAAGRVAGTSVGSNLQSQLSRLTTLVPNALRNLTRTVPSAAATSKAPVDSALGGISSIMGQVTGPYSPLGYFGVAGGWWLSAGQFIALAQNPPGVASLLSAPKPITGALAPLFGHLTSTPQSLGGTVSGAMRSAGLVGNLSVPTSWASAAPAIKTVSALVPSTALNGVSAVAAESPAGLFGGTAAGASLAGRAMDAAAARSLASTAPRTIGTAAACAGAVPIEELDNTVTILVIPPPEH